MLAITSMVTTAKVGHGPPGSMTGARTRARPLTIVTNYQVFGQFEEASSRRSVFKIGHPGPCQLAP
jgi:hypothetical protein